MSKLKFGLIGAGQIAECCVGDIKKHPEAEVVAAHDLSSERLSELCKTASIPKAYAKAEDLFADKDIDAVYIAVPNKFHVPLSIAALKAGKHVILDKPFAMNYGEAQEAADAAKKAGKILTLGMNQRFGNNEQKTKAIIASGAVGDVYHAKAFWTRRTGIPRLGTWFGNKQLAGSGCLYDIGVHMLDLCLYVINNFEPISVYGATYTKFGNRGRGEGRNPWGKSKREGIVFDVEDFATALIRFSNGATVNLDVTWACHMDAPDRNDVYVFGSEAGIHARTATIYRQDLNTGDYLRVEETEAKVEYPHNNRFHNFINHILGKESLCVPIEQSLTVQKILDAIAKSAATGHEVIL